MVKNILVLLFTSGQKKNECCLFVKACKATSNSQEYMYVLNLYVDILQSFYQQRKLKFEIDYEIPDKC